MMQYYILCNVKRFEYNKKRGELFKDATGETLEPSITDNIWKLILILECIPEIAKLISADSCEALTNLVDENS
jgi:hypothetical protein